MTNRMDITDAWIEQTDPENERNEVCYAYFHDGNYIFAIRVEYPSGDYAYFKNSDVLELLGSKAVERIERVYEEEMVA